jgi:hypothetical protein
VAPESKATAYTTFLGYYMTHSTTKRLQPKDLVVIANRCAGWARLAGWLLAGWAWLAGRCGPGGCVPVLG